MPWRPHGRAEVNARRPRAWATCDRCGMLYNHFRLDWQFQWTGNQLFNERILVCPRCMDKPQEQLRTIILPADPIPIANPRPEAYSTEEAGSFMSPAVNGQPSLQFFRISVVNGRRFSRTIDGQPPAPSENP